MDAVYFSCAFAAIAVVAFLASRALDKRILYIFAIAAALYLGLDDFVTGLPSLVKSLDFLGGHWNWTGKFLSLALSAIVIVALRLSPSDVGLTLKQRHVKVGVVALVFFVIWGTTLGLLFKPGTASTETLLFQATMPGLAEELVYRGIAPAILLGLFRDQRIEGGMPWAVILSTAVVFGAWHGLQYSNGAFGFDIMSALFPLIGSIPGGWLRFKTGSLMFPILAHSIANLAFDVAGSMVA